MDKAKLHTVWDMVTANAFELTLLIACALVGVYTIFEGHFPGYPGYEVPFHNMNVVLWGFVMVAGSAMATFGLLGPQPRIEGAAVVVLFVAISIYAWHLADLTEPVTTIARGILGVAFLLRALYLWKLHKITRNH